MTSAQYTEALAYYNLHPWGPERDNLHAGIITAAIINSTPRKNPKTVKPSDFMLIDQVSKEEEETDEFFANLDALVENPDDRSG